MFLSPPVPVENLFASIDESNAYYPGSYLLPISPFFHLNTMHPQSCHIDISSLFIHQNASITYSIIFFQASHPKQVFMSRTTCIGCQVSPPSNYDSKQYQCYLTCSKPSPPHFFLFYPIIHELAEKNPRLFPSVIWKKIYTGIRSPGVQGKTPGSVPARMPLSKNPPGFSDKKLQSAARIICPSVTDKFHTGSLSGIFSHAHVARENDFFFAACGRQTLR